MKKGQKGNVKKMIPKGQLSQAEKKNQAMEKIVLDRKEKSQERMKILYKGVMDGIGKAFEQLEKDGLGDPTFNEMNDTFFRAGHAYNARSLEEQWKNVEFVNPKDN